MLVIIALAAHEVAHLFTAVILNIKFDKVKITLFGFNFNANLENIYFIKKIVLLAAGPVCNACLYLGFRDTTYIDFAKINIFLACINMIPIIPLDGGNLCKSILEIFLETNTACRYMIMTNAFFIVCFLIIIYMYGNYLYLLLIIMALKGIIQENRRLLEKNIKLSYSKLKS
ncbi:MAG: site-2 protease family protein [Sedimentibacter sp.]